MTNINLSPIAANVNQSLPLSIYVHANGLITAGYNRSVSPDYIPYLGVEFSHPLFCKGFKNSYFEPDLRIKDAVTLLSFVLYEVTNLEFVTITYHDSPLDTLQAIAKKPDKLRLALADFLNKYVVLYAFAFGIQENTSFHHGLPCYDINLVIPSDKADIEFFNDLACFTGLPLKVKTILNNIYWKSLVKNDLLEASLVGYFGNQVCNGKAYIKSLPKNSKYKILKTRWGISDTLSQLSQPVKAKINPLNPYQLNQAIELLTARKGFEFSRNKFDKQGCAYQCIDMTNLCHLDLFNHLLKAVLTVIRKP